ncbi:uncharacterized protein ARB_04437 [Trichophyton benhamiae CBS 112371]|uniref:Uncharacterized protein n=1 Tax=Arthroderma benhamiae (strain ATCC MYA-4681 / CBS 112371) TaxID=663331 RepID=D4AJI7_ARTBC|nr:uncharacterized protein ARB_04437 [Trichophyton benhamiae CBS 112371]EFE36910.1 hypothetical protein ARB_04437 [Trichophyton benhamiae CBS 112371]
MVRPQLISVVAASQSINHHSSIHRRHQDEEEALDDWPVTSNTRLSYDTGPWQQLEGAGSPPPIHSTKPKPVPGSISHDPHGLLHPGPQRWRGLAGRDRKAKKDEEEAACERSSAFFGCWALAGRDFFSLFIRLLPSAHLDPRHPYMDGFMALAAPYYLVLSPQVGPLGLLQGSPYLSIYSKYFLTPYQGSPPAIISNPPEETTAKGMDQDKPISRANAPHPHRPEMAAKL